MQKRLNGFVDFNCTRDDYKHGIGNFLIGDYRLGLEKIHRLTRNKSESKFRADLGVTKKIKKLYEYAWLQIGKEEAKYKLIKLQLSPASIPSQLWLANVLALKQQTDPFFSLPILLFTHHVGQTSVQHVSSESCKCL